MTSTGTNHSFTPTDLRPEDLLGAVPDGLWMFDEEGRTTFANRRLAAMLGRELAEMPGFLVFDALDDEGQADFRRHLEERRRGVADGRDLPCRLLRRDGTAMWALISHAPVYADGVLRGYLYRAEDHSDQRGLLQELRHRDAQFAEVQSLARIGSWERDLRTGEVSWSDETYRLCRVDQSTFRPGADAFFGLLHPDDVGELAQMYGAMLDGGPPLDGEARLIDGAGEVSWLRVRGVVSDGEPGAPLRVGGTIQDITEVKRHTEGQEFLAELSGAANRVETLADLFFSVDHNIQLHSGWRALLASGPHYRDPGRPFFAPMQDGMPGELTRRAEELARVVFETKGTATAPSPHGTVLLAGPALVDDEVACIIVSDTGNGHPPSRSELALYEQMLHQLAQIARRERTATDLAAARDEALLASRAKSEFLATMSHEIRTPLNGVIGLGELLRHTELTQEQAGLAAGIDQAGRSLLALVNDILDLSKIEAGRLDLEEIDFELRPVLAQSVALVADQARAKGLDVDVSVASGVPRAVRGDPVRLGQVVTNLVSNAVKFTAEGRVAVRASWHEGLLRVEVEDTGIGVSADSREALFAPFTQADSSTTRTYGGTGLGLAISSRIAAATGGEIGVDTNQPVGSTFWFTMRLAASDPHAVLRGVPEDPVPARSPTPGEPTPVSGRVLVVEDNAINQLVAEGMLRRLGFAVTMADNGSAAVSWMESDPAGFDAILMDCQMPVMDGFDATRAVRALEGDARRTPIIAMTAAALTEERERCFEAGMDDFLTKPVDAGRLASVLARWVPKQDAPVPTASATPDDREGVAARLGDDAMGLDGPLVGQLVAAYDASARSSLAGLRHDARAGCADGVARHAHSLRGAAGNVGLTGVAALSLELESAAREGRLPSPEALDTLDAAIHRGAELLTEFLSAHR